MSLGGNIRRATLEIVILHILLKGKFYVYDLIQKINELSDGQYTVPEATIYPVMYRLLEKGYISDSAQESKHRIRVYYSITPAGKIYYQESLKEYMSIMSGLEKIFKQIDNNAV